MRAVEQGLAADEGAWCWGILSCRLGGAEALVKVEPSQLKPSVGRTNRRMVMRSSRAAMWMGAVCVLLIWPGLHARGEGAPGPSFSATVGGTRARFVFPVPEVPQWTWYRPTSRPNAIEYRWTAEVNSGGDSYEFGFFLYKLRAPGVVPSNGKLSKLLGVGQRSVFHDSGGETRAVLPDAKVRASQKSGTVIVEIRDPATLRLLFSKRPGEAVLRSQTPDAGLVTSRVRIEYTD